MKKTYYQPEWEVLLMDEDVVRTSGDIIFDQEGNFGVEDDSVENWEW